MVYVTGGIHGSIDPLVRFCESKSLGAGDVIVVLGDVGLNYLPAQSDDEFAKKVALNELGVEFLMVHGNHEKNPKNMAHIYKKRQRFGGSAYVEPQFENLVFAKDGECYELDGKSCIVLGGAYSVDKNYRIVHKMPWYPDEQMDTEDREFAFDTLDKLDWEVDFVLSHTCPSKVVPLEALVEGVNEYRADHSTEDFLDEIDDGLVYDTWYCGHWHISKSDGDFRFLYNDFVQLGK